MAGQYALAILVIVLGVLWWGYPRCAGDEIAVMTPSANWAWACVKGYDPNPKPK